MPRSKVVRMERLTTHVLERMLRPIILLTEASLKRSGEKTGAIYMLWTKQEALNTYIFNLSAIKMLGISSSLEGKQPCNA